MARDRQRSKARQQQRREERLKQRRDSGVARQRPEPVETPPVDDAAPPVDDSAPTVDDSDGRSEAQLEELADLEVGAPPEDLGTGAHTLRDEPPAPSFETDDEELGEDFPDEGEATVTAGPRGVRGRRTDAEPHRRGRLVAFLVAVWAELQRVQWPDRRQLTQLTGVVLFFVIIVGAYLGGLDAIFSKLIQQIL